MRKITETAHVIVRLRYINEMESTLQLGADEVIPEEFETSIQIFTRVLSRYLVPYDKIQSLVSHMRAHNYEVLCGKQDTPYPPHLQPQIPDMVFVAIPVQRASGKMIGKSIIDSGLRSKFNVTVLAIRRNNRYITEITPHMTIETDDMLYLFGNPKKIAEVNRFFILE